jgi:hypothetical protein
MFSYIQEVGIFSWIFGILIFFLLNFLTKRVQVSFLDSLGFLNINVTFAMTTLAALYSLDFVQLDDFTNASLITFSFYLGIFLISLLNRKKIKKLIQNNNLYDITVKDGLLSKNLVIIGLLCIISTVLFSILLASQGSISDDRIIIAKSLRGPDLIRQGSSILFPYIALLSLFVRRNKISIVFFAVSIFASLFSGSKGFFIPYAIAFFTINKLLYPQKKDILKNVSIIFLIIISACLVKIIWGSKPSEAFFEIINRIFSSGDAYLYAFHLTDINSLFDDYSFFPYLLHPFTSLFFVRGYEYSLGTNLFGRVTGDFSGYGPNAYLPVLLIVLLKGNIFIATLVSFFFGSVICSLRVYGLRMLSEFRRIPPFWRISTFIAFFCLTPDIFVDIGLFEQALIILFVIVISLSVFYEILGYSYGAAENKLPDS